MWCGVVSPHPKSNLEDRQSLAGCPRQLPLCLEAFILIHNPRTRRTIVTRDQLNMGPKLTSWSGVLFEKLTVVLDRQEIAPPFIQPEETLPCSQEPTTDTYPVSTLPIYILLISILILSFYSRCVFFVFPSSIPK